MQERIWWVSVTGRAEGPYTRDDVATQHAQGRVSAATPVWRDGMAEWLPAGRTDLAPVVTAPPDRGSPPTASAPPTPPPPSAHAGAPRPQPAAPWQEPSPEGWRTGPGGDRGAATGWAQHAAPSWEQHHRSVAPSNGLSIAAMVCGVVSLLFFPIILGPAGIICAGVARSRGEPRATLAMGIAAGGMVLGFLIGALVWASRTSGL